MIRRKAGGKVAACVAVGSALLVVALGLRTAVRDAPERARGSGPAHDSRAAADGGAQPLLAGAAAGELTDSIEKSICAACKKAHCRLGHGSCVAHFSALYGWTDPGGADLESCTCGCCGHQCGIFSSCSVGHQRDATPRTPLLEHVATMGISTGFPASHGVRSIAFFSRNGREYALVAAFLDDAVYVADITSPSEPSLVATLRNGQGGFRMLAGPADVAVALVDGMPHALVTSLSGNGLQVIRLEQPRSPTPAASLEDGRDGFTMLGGAHSVATVELGNKVYAVVSAYIGGGIQLIDISWPAQPRPVAAMHLPSAQGLTILSSQPLPLAQGASEGGVGGGGGHTYVFVAQYDHNALAVIDISDPHAPVPVAASAHGAGGFSMLEGASSLALFSAGGTEYALVTAEVSNGVQLLNVSEPRAPSSAGVVRASGVHFPMLQGATSVALASSENCTLGIVGTYLGNGAQLLDLTQPSRPIELAQLAHRAASDDAGASTRSTGGRGDRDNGLPPVPMRGVLDVGVRTLQGRSYAFVVGSSDNVVQVFALNVSAACAQGAALGGWTT